VGRPTFGELWRRRPRAGVRVSITVHGVTVFLCVIALLGGYAPPLATALLTLNLLAIALIALAVWIGDLPEDQRPFGPFTEAADFLGFLDERTPQGRVVRWLREQGILE
jgi:hypothetical protein